MAEGRNRRENWEAVQSVLSHPILARSSKWTTTATAVLRNMNDAMSAAFSETQRVWSSGMILA